MAKRKALYMLVTADEYELPCGVFESELSIARQYRCSQQAVNNSIYRKTLFQKKYYIISVTLSTDRENRDIMKAQRQNA